MEFILYNEVTHKLFFISDDNNIGFFTTANEGGGELHDAESYFQAIEPTLARPNSIGFGTDDPSRDASLSKEGINTCVYLRFCSYNVSYTMLLFDYND